MPELDLLCPGVARLALRTPTLPPATTTNTLIVGARRLAVIEPATPDEGERRRLDEALSARLDAGAELVAILLTHHHGDHIGYAADLRRRFGGRLLAHRATAARIPFAVDGALEDGDTVELGDGFALEALFTPGHAPGHLVFLERSTQIAYAGDLVAGEGTILIDPADDGDMGEYLASLERVAQVAPRALVPSHGPVIGAPQALLRRYIAHRLGREAKVVRALEGGPLDVADLLARVYDDTPPALWGLAERSLEAHVAKLIRDGRLQREGPRLAAVAASRARAEP